MRSGNIVIIGIFFILSFSSCRDNENRDETEMNEVQQENQTELNETESNLSEERGGEQEDVLVTVEGNPELSSFAVGFNSANVYDTLDVSRDHTVFAPTNGAYSSIYQTQGRDMLDVNTEEVIYYHFVPGEYTIEQLRQEIERGNGSYQLTTLHGAELTATLEGENVILEGNSGGRARITETINARNGIVHIIDAVLLPVED